MAKLTKTIQLGKQGITENFMTNLKNQFKNSKNVKVSVLKSAREEKSKMKEYNEEILKELGKSYTSRIIGFTIIVKKWRKDVR